MKARISMDRTSINRLALGLVRRAFAAVAFTVLIQGALPASEIRWLDGEAALAESRASGRDAVLLFTGSDWCYWCRKLETGALAQPDFTAAVSDRFVFGLVDILHRSEQPAEVVARNERLIERYGITGFPTIVLAGADGVAYGRTGYKRLDGAAFAAHLLAVQSGKGKTASIEAAVSENTGAEQARAFDALVAHRELMGLPVTRDLLERAMLADADGTAGLREPYRLRLAEIDANDAITAALQAKDLAAARRLVDAALAEAAQPPLVRQRLLHRKASIILNGPPPLDRPLILGVLDEALALAPGSDACAGLDMLREVVQRQP